MRHVPDIINNRPALTRMASTAAAFVVGWWAAPSPPLSTATLGGIEADHRPPGSASHSPATPAFSEASWREELAEAVGIADPVDRHDALLRLARAAARIPDRDALRHAFAELPRARAAIVDALNGDLSTIVAFVDGMNSAEISTGDFSALFARDPVRWLTLSYGEHGHTLLQSAADAWLSEAGTAALKFADGLPPGVRTRAIERALTGCEPDIMNPSLLRWIRELPADSIFALEAVLPAEASRDPAAVATLLNELPSSGTTFDEKKRAIVSARLALFDPERAEALVTSEYLSTEARFDLEQGFVAAVKGLWTSPHDGLLRAVSVNDPELRSRAVAAVILSQESPDTLAMLGPWLTAMPPGRIDPRSLIEALHQFPKTDPLALNENEYGGEEKVLQRMAEGERLISEAFASPADEDDAPQP